MKPSGERLQSYNDFCFSGFRTALDVSVRMQVKLGSVRLVGCLYDAIKLLCHTYIECGRHGTDHWTCAASCIPSACCVGDKAIIEKLEGLPESNRRADGM